jgi:parallel beta helix pectate lyase-like protein
MPMSPATSRQTIPAELHPCSWIMAARSRFSNHTARTTLRGWIAAQLLLVAALVAHSSGDCWSATHRVPSAYPTIQGAISAASSSDSILVGPGIYDENLDMQGKRLALISEIGVAATIVDGGQRGSVVLMQGGGVLEGFTLRNGRAQDGGGIYIANSSGTVIRNNVIAKNFAGFTLDSGRGGGIAVVDATNVLIEGNTIQDNHAAYAGGGLFELSLQGGVEFRGNLIKANTAYVAGGGAATAATDIIGNVIVNNTAGNGGAGLWCEGGLIESNTVVGNYHDNFFVQPAGILGGNATIVRNLVVHNTGRGGSGAGIMCDHGEMYCNDSWGNDLDYWTFSSCDTSGLRNFSKDPLFCNETSGDYRIADLSPCAPPLSLGCGQIGALPVACGATPVGRETWGRIKVRYR